GNRLALRIREDQASSDVPCCEEFSSRRPRDGLHIAFVELELVGNGAFRTGLSCAIPNGDGSPTTGCQSLSIRRKIHAFHFCLIALNVQRIFAPEVVERWTLGGWSPVTNRRPSGPHVARRLAPPQSNRAKGSVSSIRHVRAPPPQTLAISGGC